MSDQQLVTGLAIIISAYARLNCGMSVYHWRLIITVAWFSSSTHLATLLFLRQYLQRNRYIWYARVLLMTSLVVMLAVAIVATGAGEDALLMPAKCAYNHAGYWMYSSGNAIPMIFSNVIPLGGFLIRLIEMSSTVKRLSGGSLRTAIGKLWRRSLVWLCKKLGKAPRWAQVLFTPLVPLSLAFLVSMQVVLDFLASDSCGVGAISCVPPCYVCWF